MTHTIRQLSCVLATCLAGCIFQGGTGPEDNNGGTNGQTNGQTNGLTNAQTNGQTNAQTNVEPCEDTTVDVAPNATFLSTVLDDTAGPPKIIDLTEQNIAEGDVVQLHTEGSYKSGLNNFRSVANAVFAGSDDYREDSSEKNRIYLPIPTEDGMDAVVGDVENDLGIEEDFVVRPEAESYEVTVPPGATHLFVGVFERVYGDNRPSEAGFRVVLTCPDDQR